jgi:hypothetical protein
MAAVTNGTFKSSKLFKPFPEEDSEWELSRKVKMRFEIWPPIQRA